MRGSIADFVDIQEWAATTLANDQEFIDFCILILGVKLNSYSSFPFREEVKMSDIPSILFYSEVFEGNNTATDDFFRTWTLPFVIQIEANRNSIDVNGVTSWTSTKDLKKVAYKACEILERVSECGIEGKDIRMMSIESLATTDIDEADDLQSQVMVKFGQTTTL